MQSKLRDAVVRDNFINVTKTLPFEQITLSKFVDVIFVFLMLLCSPVCHVRQALLYPF